MRSAASRAYAEWLATGLKVYRDAGMARTLANLQAPLDPNDLPLDPAGHPDGLTSRDASLITRLELAALARREAQ
jgi:hypothetical protein